MRRHLCRRRHTNVPRVLDSRRGQSGRNYLLTSNAAVIAGGGELQQAIRSHRTLVNNKKQSWTVSAVDVFFFLSLFLFSFIFKHVHETKPAADDFMQMFPGTMTASAAKHQSEATRPCACVFSCVCVCTCMLRHWVNMLGGWEVENRSDRDGKDTQMAKHTHTCTHTSSPEKLPGFFSAG